MSNDKIIKVGDSIDLVAELFPVAWKDQENPQGQVFLNLSYNNVELDMSLNFEYDILVWQEFETGMLYAEKNKEQMRIDLKGNILK